MVFHGLSTTVITFIPFILEDVMGCIHSEAFSIRSTQYYSGIYEDIQLKYMYILSKTRVRQKGYVLCVWKTDSYFSIE